MAEPAFIVEKIIDLGFAIKKAVETVRENKEECRGVERRVLRVSELLSLVKESEMMNHHAVSSSLEDLEDAVSRAHKVIMACQGKNILCLFCAAGKLAKKLSQVQNDITHKMMQAIFASNIVMFVMTTKIQYSPRLPFFVSTNLAAAPPSGHVLSPSPALVADQPNSKPTHVHPPSHAVVVREHLISHSPTHLPVPPSRPTTYIPPPTPPKYQHPTSPREPQPSPPPPPRHLTMDIPPPTLPPPSPHLATYIPSPTPHPPSANLDHRTKHQHPRPTTQTPPPPPSPRPATYIPPPTSSPSPTQPTLPHHLSSSVTYIAPPKPEHSHSQPSEHVPLHSPSQSSKEVSAPASGSASSTHSPADVSSGKSEVKDEREKVPSRSEESSPILPGLTKFNLSELKAATHNFSKKNKIGSIDSGILYKGVLRDGLVVIIKEFRDPPQVLLARICTELLLASELQNKKMEVLASTDSKVYLTARDQTTLSENNESILRILGYGHEFMWKHRRVEHHIFLVEEYMPNGNVGNIIYGPPLDWSSRFEIIQGLARGLQYLHEQNIVHMNVKPTNILLDSEMNPKIADFGIARILDETEIRDSNIVGTVGYMPPEYILEGTLSTKYDVYSFGIVLLESISGMCRDEPARHQASVQWAWKAHKCQGMHELFDPSLCYDSQQMEIIRCLEVGLLCTQYEQAKRPTMANVLKMLSDKKELPTPKQPEYTKERAKLDAKAGSRKVKSRR
ncbi:hypothetical protein ACP70R_008586 [Stipagrostis hirtigluma subsp. patula]